MNKHEGRRIVHFLLDPSSRVSASEREKWNGWSNSATQTFQLYFMQESGNQDALRKLVTKQGKISDKKAIRLFNSAQWNRGGVSMERVDEDCDGVVFVHEIIEDFLRSEGPQDFDDFLNWILDGKFSSMDHFRRVVVRRYGHADVYDEIEKKVCTSDYWKGVLRPALRINSTHRQEEILCKFIEMI